jgi:hypothetical protein
MDLHCHKVGFEYHVFIGDIEVGQITNAGGWRIDALGVRDPFGIPGMPALPEIQMDWFRDRFAAHEGKRAAIKSRHGYAVRIGDLTVAHVSPIGGSQQGFHVRTQTGDVTRCHPWCFPRVKDALSYLSERLGQPWEDRFAEIGYSLRYSTDRWSRSNQPDADYVFEVQNDEPPALPLPYDIRDPSRWKPALITVSDPRGTEVRRRGFRAEYPRFTDPRQVMVLELWPDPLRDGFRTWTLRNPGGQTGTVTLNFYDNTNGLPQMTADMAKAAVFEPSRNAFIRVEDFVMAGFYPAVPLVKKAA